MMTIVLFLADNSIVFVVSLAFFEKNSEVFKGFFDTRKLILGSFLPKSSQKLWSLCVLHAKRFEVLFSGLKIATFDVNSAFVKM